MSLRRHVIGGGGAGKEGKSRGVKDRASCVGDVFWEAEIGVADTRSVGLPSKEDWHGKDSLCGYITKL